MVRMYQSGLTWYVELCHTENVRAFDNPWLAFLWGEILKEEMRGL